MGPLVLGRFLVVLARGVGNGEIAPMRTVVARQVLNRSDGDRLPGP